MTTRRDTLAWLMRAISLTAVGPAAAFRASAAAATAPIGPGYGTDPDLRHPTRPWPLTLDQDQLKTVTRLADLILPADAHSPAASAVGVPEFVDEWVSAPYPDQMADRPVLLAGLQWLDQAAGGRFVDLSDAKAGEILDSICGEYTERGRPARAPAPLAGDGAGETPALREAANFFRRFRAICITGFYTTPEGWADIGYVGNKPSNGYDGPPPEVLARLPI
jgi:hypothetical protein